MKFHGKYITIGVLGLISVGLTQPASAQGIFERIFGGLRHAVEAPRPPINISAFADPLTSLGDKPEPRAEGSAKAFCVRISDGFYFPVQSRPGMNAAQSCSAFCPSGKTALYSGSRIESAVANDGSRYEDLDNAYLYRKQLVAGSTCNGRDAFGLARTDVKDDPTLRPGDVVATKSGLMAFTGTTNKVADFTPVDSYRGMPKTARDKLSEVKIMPPNPGAVEPTLATITPVSDRTRGNERRRAQLDR